MRIKYTDTFGNFKLIELHDKDKDGNHWHIDEEPYVIYDYEIKNGKFNSPLHNEATKAIKEIPKVLDRIRRRKRIMQLVKKMFFISLLFTIIGCMSDVERKLYNDIITAPTKYKCTKEQNRLVKDEMEFLKRNTSYKDYARYGLSIIKHCDKIKETK